MDKYYLKKISDSLVEAEKAKAFKQNFSTAIEVRTRYNTPLYPMNLLIKKGLFPASEKEEIVPGVKVWCNSKLDHFDAELLAAAKKDAQGK